MDRITRRELARFVARNTKVDVETVRRIQRETFDLMAKSLSMGESVSVREFGRLEPVVRPPAKRRDPNTQAMIDVPARTVVRFTMARNLRARVNK